MNYLLILTLLLTGSLTYAKTDADTVISSDEIILSSELVEEESNVTPDYEIVIVDTPDDLYEWVNELEELEPPTATSSSEDLEIYDFLSEILPDYRLYPTKIRAQRRTCSALGDDRTDQGQASWYGGRFHGRRTANGEVYNQNGLTAAHKTIPFNSVVEVTYRGKKVLVRINDAGPYHGGRIIDLSREAARQLGMLNAGVGQVTIRIVSCGSK